MLLCTLASFPALILPCLLTAGLHAQFHQPSPDELKMTEDPKARGAAAVYLEVRDDSDNVLHFDSVYVRIKVLREEGKELALVDTFRNSRHRQGKDVNLDLSPPDPTRFLGHVSDIRARAIHQDGRIISLSGKPSDLLIARADASHAGRTFFVIPGAEVGCILEYSYKIQHGDRDFPAPRWDIQKPYFVHKAHYSFLPFDVLHSINSINNGMGLGTFLRDEDQHLVHSTLLWKVLPPETDIRQDVFSRFTLDLADVPPIATGSWMPPLDTLAYQVRFFYTSEFTEADYWKYQIAKWSRQVDLDAKPTGLVHAEVAKLVGANDKDLAIANKLYDAVQKLRNDDFVRAAQPDAVTPGGSASKSAERTLLDHGGTSHDIAILYLAMLRAAGLTAWDMKVVNRDKSLFARFDLDYHQLDDDIVIASLGGKEVYLDPGQKFCPFEEMHWKHAGAGGMRQGADGGSLASTPLLRYSENTAVRQGDLTLDVDRKLSGAFRFAMNGQEALRWRQAALRVDEDRLKQAFAEELRPLVPHGVHVKVDRVAGLDEPSEELIAIVSVTGTLDGSDKKATELPLSFFNASTQPTLFAEETRTLPVDMHYPEVRTDLVTYHLPSNGVTAKTPAPDNVVWKSEATYDRTFMNQAQQITTKEKLTRNFTFVTPGEYHDFRKFYLQVASDRAQPIVLPH